MSSFSFIYVILEQLYHLSIEKCNLVFLSLPLCLTHSHMDTLKYFIKAYKPLHRQFWQKCTAGNQSDKQWLVIVVTAVTCEGSDSSGV